MNQYQKYVVKYNCTQNRDEVMGMIDRICTLLIKKMRQEIPEIDDERAEVIIYGLQNIIGELPKGFIILLIAYLLGVFEQTLIAVLIIAPFRCVSGGVHMNTHIGCIIYTFLLYSGSAIIGKYIALTGLIKYILGTAIWLFGMIMITMYAPADTENVPILREKERKQKRIISYIILTAEIVIALVINNPLITSIIIFGDLFQTITITRFAYKITNNKYGHEVYANN